MRLNYFTFIIEQTTIFVRLTIYRLGYFLLLYRSLGFTSRSESRNKYRRQYTLISILFTLVAHEF
jgi:hypothetical protein